MANPNPPTEHLKETQFQPGCIGNPGGKTSEQKRREMRNAEMATLIRERMLEAQIAKMAAAEYVPEVHGAHVVSLDDDPGT